MHYTQEELSAHFRAHENAKLSWDFQTNTPIWPLLLEPRNKELQLAWMNPLGIRVLLSYPEGEVWLQQKMTNDNVAYLHPSEMLSSMVACLGPQKTHAFIEPIQKSLLLYESMKSLHGKSLWSLNTLLLRAEAATPEKLQTSFEQVLSYMFNDPKKAIYYIDKKKYRTR